MPRDFTSDDQYIRPFKDCLPYSESDTMFTGSQCYRRSHPQDIYTSCRDPSTPHSADHAFFDRCHPDEFCIDGVAPHQRNQSERGTVGTAYCISSPAFLRIDNDRSGKKHIFTNTITGDLPHTPQNYIFQVVLAGKVNTDGFFAERLRLKVKDRLGNDLKEEFCQPGRLANSRCTHISMSGWPDEWDHFQTEIRFPKNKGPKSVGIFWAVLEIGKGFEEFR